MFPGEILCVVLVLCFTGYFCLRAFLDSRKREDSTRVELAKEVYDDIEKLKSQVSALTLQRGINR